MTPVTYSSTRGGGGKITASEAILTGLAPDGGLFVPDHIPALKKSLQDLKDLTYQDLAFEILHLFFTDYTDEELKSCIEKAYDEKFDCEEIAPLSEADGRYFLELFHGKTIAFKDMALSILPHLLTTAAKKNGVTDEIVILTATSGDTGKAALAGFADVPGIRIVVFYPKDGVSAVQKQQMVTQKGENTFVVGINGNFDEAQTGVKNMFHDTALKEELSRNSFRFSSANSINIGRLVPQIVYYVYAYLNLLKNGIIGESEEINICVPTGNFGNILAAYYAKEMGLPVHKLICASNRNKVLFDFFDNGTYNKNRAFYVTSSPSMDILVSSNLERMIYLATGSDPVKTKELMDALSSNGEYSITEEMKQKFLSFYGGFADEEETAAEIREVFSKASYVIDPHTAVASKVYRDYRNDTKDDRKTVIASTASPYKFTESVMRSLGEDVKTTDPFVLSDALSELSNVPVPKAVTELKDAEVRHKTVCEIGEMKDTVKKFLGM